MITERSQLTGNLGCLSDEERARQIAEDIISLASPFVVSRRAVEDPYWPETRQMFLTNVSRVAAFMLDDEIERRGWDSAVIGSPEIRRSPSV